MVGFPPPSSEFVCRILDVFYCSVDALRVGTCLVLYIVVYVSQIIISLPLRVVPFSLTVNCRCVFSKRFIIFLVDFFFFCGYIIFGVASWRRICECCTSFRNCFANKKIFIKVVGQLVINM